jgi:hypothetical protein
MRDVAAPDANEIAAIRLLAERAGFQVTVGG